MKHSSMEEELKEKGICLSTTVGTSMYPMLRNRQDTIVIKPVTGKLQKYDVALYKRPNGCQYVLHRVVGVKKEQYAIRGDNQGWTEYPVPQDWIVGVLDGFYRGEKYIDVKNPRYRAYVSIWNFLFPLRALWMRGRDFASILKKKIYH